ALPILSLVKEAEAQLLVENRNSEAHTLQNAHLHFLAPVEVALGLLQIGQVSGETHQASIGQRLFRYLHETALARENDMKARALGSSALLGFQRKFMGRHPIELFDQRLILRQHIFSW